MPLGFRPGDADCAILAESAQPSAYLGKSAYWTDWSRFRWCWWAGRESNPHSLSTADLQSAELTTCSTYPGRKRPARWSRADRAEYTQPSRPTSTGPMALDRIAQAHGG